MDWEPIAYALTTKQPDEDGHRGYRMLGKAGDGAFSGVYELADTATTASGSDEHAAADSVNGCVNECVNGVNRVWVLKVTQLDNPFRRHSFMRDCYFLKLLQSSGCVPALGLERPWLCRERGYIIMQRLSTDLFEWLSARRQLKPDAPTEHYLYPLPRYILIQMVELLIKVSSYGVYHGDIKLENFVIDQPTKRVYLVDFGSSTDFSSQFPLIQMFGTPLQWRQHSFLCRPHPRWNAGVVCPRMCLRFNLWALECYLLSISGSIRLVQHEDDPSSEGAMFAGFDMDLGRHMMLRNLLMEGVGGESQGGRHGADDGNGRSHGRTSFGAQHDSCSHTLTAPWERLRIRQLHHRHLPFPIEQLVRTSEQVWQSSSASALASALAPASASSPSIAMDLVAVETPEVKSSA